MVFVCLFVLFLLAIVLSVRLRFTDSDYLFGIFKLFFILNVKKLQLTTKFHCQELKQTSVVRFVFYGVQ